jgi:imidazolonepropionase-like amidohydrolase
MSKLKSYISACFVACLTMVAMLTAPASAAEEKPKPQTLFINCNIFDGVSDKLATGRRVLVEGNLIKEIGDKGLKAAGHASVIDCGGRTLMPGLIDSHTHFNVEIDGGLKELEAARWDEIAAISAYAAEEWLMDGFTTIRDMGGMGNGLKRTIDKGLLKGPRIYPSGAYISQTSGHGDLLLGSQRDPQTSNLVRLGITILADGRDAVRAAVRKNFAEGASQIKIMMGGGISSEKGPLFAPQFTDEEVRAAVEEAATRDTYVATHIYHPHHIKRALELGVLSIEHGQFIDEPTAILLKEKGAFISPFTAGFSPESLKHPVYGKKGSPQNIKALEFQGLSKDFIEVINKVKPKLVLAIDVVFLTGNASRQNRDFEKWTFADYFGNHQALMSMTSVPGELAALTGKNNPYPHKLGVIEEGAYADILIVDGNPLKDITTIGANPKYFDAKARGLGIETMPLIMKDGKVYKNTLK